jgi:hypothetical protein
MQFSRSSLHSTSVRRDIKQGGRKLLPMGVIVELMGMEGSAPHLYDTPNNKFFQPAELFLWLGLIMLLDM